MMTPRRPDERGNALRQSPLASSTKDLAVSIDRRRHRRYTMQIDAAVTTADGTQLIGSLLELSSGGAFIGAPIEVQAGDAMFIRFMYQDAHKCEATGHVVRLLPFGRTNGVAMRFGVANAQLQALIRTLAQMPEALQTDVLHAISRVEVRFG